MTVLVTGGTGFVGSHTARRLLNSGTAVRLLVRDPGKADKRFADMTTRPDIAEGDVRDEAAVKSALAGCDALVHAAAATPMAAADQREMVAVNVDGTRNVVGQAVAAGLERIVVLSSITALFRRDGDAITPDAEPVPSRLPYGQSKVEAEYFLRQLQSRGAPVATLYPGGVIGPDDPGFSDTCRALKHRVENGFRIFGDGGMQHIDVRDLADCIAALLRKSGGQRSAVSSAQSFFPGRYLLPGVYLTWTELADTIESASGCTLQRIPAQGWKLRMVGQLMDFARLFRTLDSPISAETMRYATLWPNIANAPQLAQWGVNLRAPVDTFADTMAWMVRAGHLDAGLCPGLDAANR